MDSNVYSKHYLHKPDGELTLIYGPMFSGKTTKLIELYNKALKSENNVKEKCLAINYALDERYGKNQIISHDSLNIDCLSIIDLNLINPDNLVNANYIFINEAQFFKNIKDWTHYVVKFLKKNVILCGLDLDYKRKNFGNFLELIDVFKDNCNTFKLAAKCCGLDEPGKCKNPAIYTHRIAKNDELILIGSKEYIPLCRYCFQKFNKDSYADADADVDSDTDTDSELYV